MTQDILIYITFLSQIVYIWSDWKDYYTSAYFCPSFLSFCLLWKNTRQSAHNQVHSMSLVFVGSSLRGLRPWAQVLIFPGVAVLLRLLSFDAGGIVGGGGSNISCSSSDTRYTEIKIFFKIIFLYKKILQFYNSFFF